MRLPPPSAPPPPQQSEDGLAVHLQALRLQSSESRPPRQSNDDYDTLSLQMNQLRLQQSSSRSAAAAPLLLAEEEEDEDVYERSEQGELAAAAADRASVASTVVQTNPAKFPPRPVARPAQTQAQAAGFSMMNRGRPAAPAPPPPPPPSRLTGVRRPAERPLLREEEEDDGNDEMDEGDDNDDEMPDVNRGMGSRGMQYALQHDPLAAAARAAAGPRAGGFDDGSGDGSGGGSGIPDEEWEPTSIKTGIYEYYDLTQAAQEQDEGHGNSSYCAICSPAGRLPPIDEQHIQMIQDAIVKGIKTGRILEACKEVHNVWNHIIRQDIQRIIDTETKRKIVAGMRNKGRNGAFSMQQLAQQKRALLSAQGQYDPFPEWTLKSIVQHLLYHTNDPVIFSIRNALKLEAVADYIAKHGIAKQHTSKCYPGTTKRIEKADLGAARTFAMLVQTATRMLRETYTTFLPKSGGKNGSGNVFYQQPGQGPVDNMYRNHYQSKKVKL